MPALKVSLQLIYLLCIASGAELIESLRRTRVKIQEKNEKEILQKIKQKMDRIKATQQKLQTTSMIHSHGKHSIFLQRQFVRQCGVSMKKIETFCSRWGKNVCNHFLVYKQNRWFSQKIKNRKILFLPLPTTLSSSNKSRWCSSISTNNEYVFLCRLSYANRRRSSRRRCLRTAIWFRISRWIVFECSSSCCHFFFSPTHSPSVYISVSFLFFFFEISKQQKSAQFLQAPSPSSAIMGVSHSLDAYLEPNRLSFSSPPASELIQQGHSSDDSYPVFSPLPVSRKQSLQSNALVPAVPATSSATATTTTTSSNTLQPGSFVRQHRRQSSINTVSWTDQGETCSGRIRHISTNLDPSHVSLISKIRYVFIRQRIFHLTTNNSKSINKNITIERKPKVKRASHYDVVPVIVDNLRLA